MSEQPKYEPTLSELQDAEDAMIIPQSIATGLRERSAEGLKKLGVAGYLIGVVDKNLSTDRLNFSGEINGHTIEVVNSSVLVGGAELSSEESARFIKKYFVEGGAVFVIDEKTLNDSKNIEHQTLLKDIGL